MTLATATILGDAGCTPDDLGELPSLEELLQRPAWHARAACRGYGTGAFFPSRDGPQHDPEATCRRCEVRDDCLAYAMADSSLVGCWGGTTARERRILRRKTA